MKKIKNKIVIVLILLLSTQELLRATLLKIGQVQEKNIEHSAKDVGQLLFKHRVATISLTVVSGLANFVELCRCLQFFYNKYSPSPTTECLGDCKISHSIEPKNEKYNRLARGVAQVAIGIKNLLISKESCYALLLGSSAIVTQKLMANVNHPYTMTWFVYKKVPYKKMFDQVSEYAKLVGDSTLDKEKNIYYKQTLNSLCNQIVRCVEQLCGFMLYKSTQLTESEQKEAQSIIRYLSHCTNAWGRAIDKLLNQEFFDPQQFIKRVTDFQEGLERELGHFACVERETSIDVMQVIGMHKQL